MAGPKTPQSLLVRVINRAGAPFKSRISLDPDDLMQRARALTHLDDFGEPGFEVALGVLVESYLREARLNFMGRVLTQKSLLHCLTTRLQIEEYFRRNPQTANVPVPDPIIIAGAPRTGTTMLHGMLGADPANRTLKVWELFAPVPPGFTPCAPSDPRPEAVAQVMARYESRFMSAEGRRQVNAAHMTRPNDPQECFPLLQNSFASEVFGLFARADQYVRWLLEQDLTPAFRYHRRQIQLLTAAQPAARLVLKHPAHLSHLEEIFRVYPRARVIQTHRDPAEVIGSMCSLCDTARGLHTDFVDRNHIGATVCDVLSISMERGMQARKKLDPDRFLDIHYRDLTANPMNALRTIYSWLGIPMTPELERTFAGYLDRDRQERANHRHSYDLERYGLNAADVRSRYPEYIAQYLPDTSNRAGG